MFRTLYHAGLRSDEASQLEKPDLHFTRGPFGKLHVRFGKGAPTSGPRPRWVPMLDGLDSVLRWFLEELFRSGKGLAALTRTAGAGPKVAAARTAALGRHEKHCWGA